MVRPDTKTPPFDGNGFVVAALLAPGMALAIFYLGIGLTDLTDLVVGPAGAARLIGSFLLLLLIVSVWGALPTLMFGGLVLAVIQRIPWRGRATPMVFPFGGVMAAGLYMLTGLGTAGLSPGAAMFFAPWATPDLWGPGAGEQNWWLIASLLLAGAAAGLIYSAFAKRG